MELGKHKSGKSVAVVHKRVIGGRVGCVRDVKRMEQPLFAAVCSQQSGCGQLHGRRVAPEEWEPEESEDSGRRMDEAGLRRTACGLGGCQPFNYVRNC